MYVYLSVFVDICVHIYMVYMCFYVYLCDDSFTTSYMNVNVYDIKHLVHHSTHKLHFLSSDSSATM